MVQSISSLDGRVADGGKIHERHTKCVLFFVGNEYSFTVCMVFVCFCRLSLGLVSFPFGLSANVSGLGLVA